MVAEYNTAVEETLSTFKIGGVDDFIPVKVLRHMDNNICLGENFGKFGFTLYGGKNGSNWLNQHSLLA